MKKYGKKWLGAKNNPEADLKKAVRLVITFEM